MFMDLKTLSWSKECLDFFGVNEKCLPKIVSNCEVYGKMGTGVLKGVPIAGMIGDQQAALVGQMCLVPGTAKNTYGELVLYTRLGNPLSMSIRYRLLHVVQHRQRRRPFHTRSAHNRMYNLHDVVRLALTLDSRQVAYKAGPDSETDYALEGSIAVAGSSIKWSVSV